MDPIASITSVSSKTIAQLQAEMALYTQMAYGANSVARADYTALQTALKSGNVLEAQAALVRLQHDSRIATTATPSTTPPASPSVVGNGVPVGGTNAAQPSSDNSINATA